MSKSQYSFSILVVAFSFAAIFVQPATATGDKFNTGATTISDFVGYYSVYEKCPKYDFNTGMLHISLEHISMTETGCEIVSFESQNDGKV